MNPAAPLLISLALLTLVGSAQDQTVPFPELDALTKEYAARVTAADGPHLVALAELDKKYLARLVQEQKTAQQAGKLEDAMALEAEKKAISSGGGVPEVDDAKTPAVLKQMHAMYRAGHAKLALARDKNLKPLRDDYAKKLDALGTGLTKLGKLQEAMTVKKFRESLPAVSAAASSSPATSANQAAGKVMSVDLPGEVVMKFCYCQPGSFKMGSPPEEKNRGGNEHQVRVHLSKGFWLAQTECTQAQWMAIMSINPSLYKGNDLPVERVSWNDAQKFITQLNDAKTLPAGYKAALPTEAQWEYACRAGTKTAYSFGETLNAMQANNGKPQKKTCAVASYPANAWGLYDMHGNVWEWCEDWLGEKLPGGTDPTGVTSGTCRVARGGGFNSSDSCSRAAERRGYDPASSDAGRGFRVALISVP